MGKLQRLEYYSIVIIGLILTAIFGVWWVQPGHIPTNFSGASHIIDVILFLVLTYIVWYQIVNEVFSWIVARNMSQPHSLLPEKGLKVAFLTAFVPGTEPLDMLENTLKGNG